jgi:hypothetical protein
VSDDPFWFSISDEPPSSESEVASKRSQWRLWKNGRGWTDQFTLDEVLEDAIQSNPSLRVKNRPKQLFIWIQAAIEAFGFGDRRLIELGRMLIMLAAEGDLPPEEVARLGELVGEAAQYIDRRWSRKNGVSRG